VAPDPVEDHLLVECAKWAGRTDLAIATRPEFEPAAHFIAQLQALAAIGLLDGSEVAAWRERFEEVRGHEEVVVDAALRERAERYLESLLLDSPPEDEGPDPLASALQVLEEIGVLGEEESGRWLERAYAAEDADDDEDDDDDDWPAFDERELRRVLLGPSEETGGFRVTSVELYSQGVVVRWSARGGEVGGAEPEPDLVLSDDMGTVYEPTGGGSAGGGSELTRGEAEFVPAVPDEASRLVVRGPGGPVTLELGR
jgi:hypothetical protein